MNERIERLERSVRRLQCAVAVLLLAGVVAGAAAFSRPGRGDDVIRTRGIVVVDAAGRERILIGAPIPAAAGRVRTDMRRVEALWGPRFPREYVTRYYPTYRHTLHGMLVLDEQGFDRLAVGDSVPDPNIGQRVGVEAGLVVNDAQGFERTGYGLLRVDSAYRVVLGLDGAEGREGVALVVDDASGRRGMDLAGDSAEIFVGHAPAGMEWAGIPPGFLGIQVKHGAERRVIRAGTP